MKSQDCPALPDKKETEQLLLLITDCRYTFLSIEMNLDGWIIQKHISVTGGAGAISDGQDTPMSGKGHSLFMGHRNQRGSSPSSSKKVSFAGTVHCEDKFAMPSPVKHIQQEAGTAQRQSGDDTNADHTPPYP